MGSKRSAAPPLHWTCLLLLGWTVFSCGVFSSRPARAQDSAAAAREKEIAERFLQALLRRPRRGTALDRVYGYHVQAGTLDELIEQQTALAESGGEDAGAHYMLVGLLQLQSGNDAEAADSFQNAEPLRPDDAMASYYRGKSLLQIGRGNQAAEALERSIDRKPARADAIDVFTELGRLYQRTQQTQKALDVWQRLEEAFPGDARVSEQIAATLAEEGQHEEALRRYEKLAESSAASSGYRSVGYRIAAAELKRRMGRDGEALEDFESLLSRLRPSSWLYSDVRRRIEAGFLRTGDYAGLADYYAQQVEEKPDEVALRLRHAQTLAQAGRLNEAESALSETVRLAPEEADVRLAMVDVLKTAGKAAEAAEQLEILVEHDPENPDYLVGLGNTWLEAESLSKTDRRAKAHEAWTRLAEARQDDAVIAAQVGDLMRRIERTDEALKLYRRAVELAPDQPQYREYLGEYLHRLGREEEALNAWNSIAEGPRATRDNLIRLAEVLNTFEYPDKALESFARAAELDPTFSQRLRYAELLSRAERYDDALTQLQQAEQIVETPEDREQLLRSRIEVYHSSGELEQRIVATRRTAQKNGTADAYRELALMLDAATRLTEATEAIEAAKAASPNDAAVLSVAAELYRKASRYADAIDTYQSLAEIDSRFLTNYLKRITGLQMQLGQVEQALQTAGDLIAAQPGNPESYRFYAQQCFRIGRDEEGIAKLRQALQTSSRDAETKRALASALAERFRTDEAIELYWQLVDDTEDLDEQEGLVASLAELYERKGDFDRLLSRLELHGRESSDMRTATLLTAAAHRAIGDLGSARQTLEPLLAQNPRDADLLRQMVSLSVAADDPATALRYQEQLVALADTPENRRQLLGLMVDSGQIDAAEATLQRLRGLDDPVTMINVIDRAMRRGENQAATRFCRSVLEQHPDLWEVRTRLAGLLMASGETEQALEQAGQIQNLELAADEKSESQKAQQASRPRSARSSNTRASSRSASRLDATRQAYRLSALFGIGRYASATFGSGGGGTAMLDVDNYGEARFIATAIRLAAAAKQDELDQTVQELLGPDKTATSDDVEQLWDAYYAVTLQTIFGPRPSNQADYLAQQQEQLTPVLWRLAELDRDERSALVSRLLSMRQTLRNPPDSIRPKPPKPDPLDDRQLALATQTEKDIRTRNTGTPDLSVATALYDELVAAGKDSQAEVLRGEFDPAAQDAEQLILALQFHAGADRKDDVTTILRNIRERLPQWAGDMKADQTSKLSSALLATLGSEELSQETRLMAVDLVIAARSLANTHARPSRSSRQSGTINAYYFVGGNYQNQQIQVPFSERLLPRSFAQQFYSSVKFGIDSPEREKLVEHLNQDITIFPDGSQHAAAEKKFRRVFSAFARWWIEQPEAAYREIVEASKAAPEDNELWIERARLAAELDRPEASLEALDGINPLNHETLRVRELAALNLASQLGKLERAKAAARRLFGMRLDSDTEMALADQLNRLGMREMATAVLQRSRRRGGQTPQDLLQLAQRYLDSDDSEAAAEVAFQALQKVSAGNQSNARYYRQQAVQLLRRAGRLEGLLKQAQRRAAAAPKSLRLKAELAELYTAAGRTEDANKVFDEIARQKPNDPQTLWRTATRLADAGKHGAAVDKYLAAIEKDPELLSRDFYEFERAVTSSKKFDEAFRALSKTNLSTMNSYVVGRLSSLYGRSPDDSSEAAEAFLHHLLETSDPDSLGHVLQDLGNEEKALQSKVVRDAILRILDDDQTYQAQSEFWPGNSTSGGGTARGPLKPVLAALRSDDELRNAARKKIAQRTESDATSALAELLLVAIDHRSVDAEEIESRTRELIEQQSGDIPYRLWWQLGQELQEQEKFRDLAIEVLEHARELNDSNQGSSDYQFTIDARLTDLYVNAGERQKALQQLLKAYEQTDHSDRNQYNPGYGDYQELRAYLSIAQKLVEIEFPLEAIRVYTNTLAEPGRFAAAENWTSRDYQSQFQSGLDSALEKLSEEDFRAYLDAERSRTTEEVTDAGGEHLFDLVPLAAMPGMDPARSSIAAIVMSSLAETDEGRKTLAAFDQQITERQKSHPEDPSLDAAAAMVATVLGREDAAERFKKLTKRLPKQETEPEEGQDFDAMLAWYSPALLGLTCDQAAVRAEANRLADRLISIATAVERSDISQTLTLAKLKQPGDSSDPERVAETMRRMLEVTAAKGSADDPPRVVTTAIAAKCVEIAELAADAGAWDVSMEALRRGFSAGPPLRTVSQNGSSSSAFVLPSSRRSAYSSASSSSNRDAENLAPLVARIASLMESFERRVKTEETSADAELAYTTLRDIVFPESRPEEAFPYAADLFDRRSAGVNDPSRLETTSLARRLAVTASAAGKAEALAQFLKQRPSTGKSAHGIGLVRIQLALEGGDDAAMERALGQMAAALGIDVSATSKASSAEQREREKRQSAGVPTGSAASVAASSQRPPQSSSNAMLHAVLPVHRKIGVTPAVAAVEMHLLENAARSTEMAQALDTWKWVAKELIASQHLSDPQAQRVVDACLRTTRRRYENYVGNIAQTQASAQRAALARPAVRSGRWALAGDLLQEFAREKSGMQASDTTLADFAIALLDAGPEDQYQVLSRMVFGNEGDTPPRRTATLVLAATPPPELRPAAERLESASEISIGHRDFPIISTSLMIADAAAACGRTGELVDRLRPHIEHPGDEIDAMIGLALLSADRVDAAEEVFSRVAKRLEETKPDKGVNSPLPIASSLLAARCLSVDGLEQQTAEAWDDLLMHARRRGSGLLVSFYSRVVSGLGLHPAAGATEGSPLKHWTSVQIPFHNAPALDVTEPLYALREGTLRYAAGPDQAALMLKYPLEGEFTFGHRNIHHGWSESHNTFGGTAYQTRTFNKTVRLVALVGRKTVDFPNDSSHQSDDNRNEIEVAGDKVIMKVNGHRSAVDQRTRSMPFVGVVFKTHVIAEVADIRIDGEPTIPRQVDLIAPRLRGWSCPILGGMLPDPHLPIGPDEDPVTVKQRRQHQAENARVQKTWYVEGKELRSGTSSTSFNPGGQRHIQYQRPLLRGETLSYEFFHQPGEQEVHPTIGRVALLLRPGGVKLRWLPQARSLESTAEDALHEIDPAEPLSGGKPKLLAGQWNRVTLTADESTVTVNVNGEAVCRFETARDRRFGLLGEKERSCRIRGATLSGPWPEKLPEDLMEKR